MAKLLEAKSASIWSRVAGIGETLSTKILDRLLTGETSSTIGARTGRI